MKNLTITKNQNSFSKFIKLTKQALRGDQQDYTSLSIRRSVFLLSIPMILEMIMESIFALVDLFFVNKLGAHATSTVGLTESFLTLIYSIAIGLSAASTAIVARRIGEKNETGASQAALQAIMLALFVTSIISVLGYIFAGDILKIMGAEPKAIEMGTNYTRVMFAGCGVIILLFLINGIFRGAGDASIAMKSLWIANICNIILCPLLINGWGIVPAMGLTGAAVATTIGRGIGVLYQLYILFSGKGAIYINLRKIFLDIPIIRSLIYIAYPATIQFIIASASWIVLAALVAEGGSNASAGYQTAIRIVMFFILPAWGLSNAAATLVGQNLGAKQPERAEQVVFKTAKYNAIFMGIATVIFMITAPWMVRFFTPAHETEQIHYAVDAMRFVSAGYIFYGIGMVVSQAFNGAGDTRTPTIISFFGFWVFQIPLAYGLTQGLGWMVYGVFIAVPVAETLIAVVSYVIFRQGKWKTVQV